MPHSSSRIYDELGGRQLIILSPVQVGQGLSIMSKTGKATSRISGMCMTLGMFWGRGVWMGWWGHMRQ